MATFEIVKRYTAEDKNSNLSCGGNIEYLNLKNGEKVLDLGCGRGGESIQAAKQIGSEGHVWGLDLTPRMIELAQERAQNEQVKNAEFLLGSMDHIPLKDNCLDAVLSNCAINHVENKTAVYQEIFRVLKPGGRFVVSDIMTEEPLPHEIRTDPEAIADCFGGAITLKEYEQALNDAGFNKVSVFKERRYMKNGFEMISRTFQGFKEN